MTKIWLKQPKPFTFMFTHTVAADRKALVWSIVPKSRLKTVMTLDWYKPHIQAHCPCTRAWEWSGSHSF